MQANKDSIVPKMSMQTSTGAEPAQVFGLEDPDKGLAIKDFSLPEISTIEPGDEDWTSEDLVQELADLDPELCEQVRRTGLLMKSSGREDPEKALAQLEHVFGEHRGLNMSIEASAAFKIDNPATHAKLIDGRLGPDQGYFFYSRLINPTVMKLAAKVAAVEGTEAAYCTSSGMSAISSLLLHLCNTGDHVVASPKLYGGSQMLMETFLPQKCNITTTFVDLMNLENLEKVLREKKPKVLFFEGVSNPTLNVANIPLLCNIAHKFGVKVVVDNTLTPMILSPARLGADIVVHSMTKYFSGGEDIVAGVVCGSKELVNSMVDFNVGPLLHLGPTMNPKIAFELSLRTPSLGLRMKEHSIRALEYAKLMKKRGLKVIYPGLKDHNDHLLLWSMANKYYGYGGIVCVEMESKEKANKFIEHLQNNKFGIISYSLGHHETLMMCYVIRSTGKHMNNITMMLTGIRHDKGLVRLSIGYSGTVELRKEQLNKAIDELQSSNN